MMRPSLSEHEAVSGEERTLIEVKTISLSSLRILLSF